VGRRKFSGRTRRPSLASAIPRDLAREAGSFDITIHHRHPQQNGPQAPHVFGNVKADTRRSPQELAQIKAKEKQSSIQDRLRRILRLDGCQEVSALLEAYQLTRRAAQVALIGKVAGILEKLEEEL